MNRAAFKASGVMAAILCSWVAGCAQSQTAHPPAVPSAGAPGAAGQPGASGQPSSTSKADDGKESGSSATTGTSSNKASGSEKAGGQVSGSAGEAAAEEGSETAGGAPAAQTPDEQRDTLDRNLQASLGTFDAMLLKEQVEAATRRAEHGTGVGSGSGSGTGSGGEAEGAGEGEGGGAGGPSGGGSAAGSKGGAAEKRGGSQGKDARAGGEKGGAGDKDKSTGSSSGGSLPGGGGRVVTSDPEGTPPADTDDRVPADVGDGHDDDVVARQLREAAMSEEDPAIREKLWDEYRRYKRGES
jgi:hypothetical protein